MFDLAQGQETSIPTDRYNREFCLLVLSIACADLLESQARQHPHEWHQRKLRSANPS